VIAYDAAKLGSVGQLAMKRYLLLVLATLIFCSMQVSAKPVVKTLDCGKQGVGTAAKAEMALAGSIYTVSVTFFGQEPSKSEMDRVLRECVAAAAKIDSKKDILATPWLRANVKDNPLKDKMLSPYGAMSAIAFEASGQKVVVREAKPAR
jgi:hypothetical protein